MTKSRQKPSLAVRLRLLWAGVGCALYAVAAASIHGNAAQARDLLESLNFPVDQAVGYSEQQFNPMLSRPIDSHGQLWLEADGTMVMQVESPRAEQRRLNGDRLSLARGASHLNGRDRNSAEVRQIRLKPKRSTHMILLAASALLRGDIDWLSQHFELSFSGSLIDNDQSQSWEVLLVPTSEGLREQLPWISLHGRAQQLLKLRADRGAKGWQQLEFEVRGVQ